MTEPIEPTAMLKRLEELEKNATKGKWLPIVPDASTVQMVDKKSRFNHDIFQEKYIEVMAVYEPCSDQAMVGCSTNHFCVELLQQEDNMKLICEMKNSLPFLIEYIRSLEAQIDGKEQEIGISEVVYDIID